MATPQTSDSSSLALGLVLTTLVEELKLIWGDKGDGGAASDGLSADVLSKLGGVSLETLSLHASADLGGTNTHDTGVNTAGDAVLLLDVDLGQIEVRCLESKVVFDVSL